MSSGEPAEKACHADANCGRESGEAATLSATAVTDSLTASPVAVQQPDAELPRDWSDRDETVEKIVPRRSQDDYTDAASDEDDEEDEEDVWVMDSSAGRTNGTATTMTLSTDFTFGGHSNNNKITTSNTINTLSVSDSELLFSNDRHFHPLNDSNGRCRQTRAQEGDRQEEGHRCYEETMTDSLHDSSLSQTRDSRSALIADEEAGGSSDEELADVLGHVATTRDDRDNEEEEQDINQGNRKVIDEGDPRTEPRGVPETLSSVRRQFIRELIFEYDAARLKRKAGPPPLYAGPPPAPREGVSAMDRRGSNGVGISPESSMTTEAATSPEARAGAAAAAAASPSLTGSLRQEEEARDHKAACNSGSGESRKCQQNDAMQPRPRSAAVPPSVAPPPYEKAGTQTSAPTVSLNTTKENQASGAVTPPSRALQQPSPVEKNAPAAAAASARGPVTGTNPTPPIPLHPVAARQAAASPHRSVDDLPQRQTNTTINIAVKEAAARNEKRKPNASAQPMITRKVLQRTGRSSTPTGAMRPPATAGHGHSSTTAAAAASGRDPQPTSLNVLPAQGLLHDPVPENPATDASARWQPQQHPSPNQSQHAGAPPVAIIKKLKPGLPARIGSSSFVSAQAIANSSTQTGTAKPHEQHQQRVRQQTRSPEPSSDRSPSGKTSTPLSDPSAVTAATKSALLSPQNQQPQVQQKQQIHSAVAAFMDSPPPPPTQVRHQPAAAFTGGTSPREQHARAARALPAAATGASHTQCEGPVNLFEDVEKPERHTSRSPEATAAESTTTGQNGKTSKSPSACAPTHEASHKVSTAASSAASSWTPPPVRSRSQPSDEPHLVVAAVKYSYDVGKATWGTTHVMVRVLHPNRGLSQGGMRVAFEVEELDETGFSSPMVAKMFRHNITDVVEADYFNEGEAQCLCEEFTDSFNKVVIDSAVERANISFLQCSVVKIPKDDVPEKYRAVRKGFFSYRTTDTRDIIFCMEPRLTGNFTKYTSNCGDVYETNERYISPSADRHRRSVLAAVEAFSHFTLVESGGSMLVCDLQGVNDFLTDPQIHTEDGKGLGMGNLGQKGIDEWMKTHKCNAVCKAMHLQPLDEGKRSLQEKRRGSYFRSLAARLQNQDPVRPPDYGPLPRPLEQMTDEERFEYALHLSNLMEN